MSLSFDYFRIRPLLFLLLFDNFGNAFPKNDVMVVVLFFRAAEKGPVRERNDLDTEHVQLLAEVAAACTTFAFVLLALTVILAFDATRGRLIPSRLASSSLRVTSIRSTVSVLLVPLLLETAFGDKCAGEILVALRDWPRC